MELKNEAVEVEGVAEIEEVEEEVADVNAAYPRAKYVVPIVRDKKMLGVFAKFYARVSHPRATTYMVFIGGMLTALPLVQEGIKLPGIIICSIVGPIMLLLGLFRHHISVSMMAKNPETMLDKKLVYLMTNKGVQIDDGESTSTLGAYSKIHSLWEDEKHFYIGINDDDLVILPRANFEYGDPDTFREFLLEKSGASFCWKPTRIDHILKKMVMDFKIRMNQQSIEREEAMEERKKRRMAKKKNKVTVEKIRK